MAFHPLAWPVKFPPLESFRRSPAMPSARRRARFHLGSVERLCDNGAVAVDTPHFKELAIFISSPVAVHWDLRRQIDLTTGKCSRRSSLGTLGRLALQLFF